MKKTLPFLKANLDAVQASQKYLVSVAMRLIFSGALRSMGPLIWFLSTPTKRAMLSISTGPKKTSAQVELLLEDANPIVRAMAAWAYSNLAEGEAFSDRRRFALKTERDPDVIAEWCREPSGVAS